MTSPAQLAQSGATCWQILGIEPTEDEHLVKRTYRSKARRFHPDAGGTEADFNAVTLAYDEACDRITNSWRYFGSASSTPSAAAPADQPESAAPQPESRSHSQRTPPSPPPQATSWAEHHEANGSFGWEEPEFDSEQMTVPHASSAEARLRVSVMRTGNSIRMRLARPATKKSVVIMAIVSILMIVERNLTKDAGFSRAPEAVGYQYYEWLIGLPIAAFVVVLALSIVMREPVGRVFKRCLWMTSVIALLTGAYSICVLTFGIYYLRYKIFQADLTSSNF